MNEKRLLLIMSIIGIFMIAICTITIKEVNLLALFLVCAFLMLAIGSGILAMWYLVKARWMRKMIKEGKEEEVNNWLKTLPKFSRGMH